MARLGRTVLQRAGTLCQQGCLAMCGVLDGAWSDKQWQINDKLAQNASMLIVTFVGGGGC